MKERPLNFRPEGSGAIVLQLPVVGSISSSVSYVTPRIRPLRSTAMS